MSVVVGIASLVLLVAAGIVLYVRRETQRAEDLLDSIVRPEHGSADAKPQQTQASEPSMKLDEALLRDAPTNSPRPERPDT